MSDLPPPPPDGSGWSSQPPPPPGPASHSDQAMPGSATLGTGERVELAGRGWRLAARAVDGVFVGLLNLVALLIDPFFLPILVGGAYEIAFIALKGRTPGKWVTSIKVVRADNGDLPSWGAAAGRWIIPAIGYLLFVIPGLLIHASLLWDDRRQGWHDKAVKTLVVSAPR